MRLFKVYHLDPGGSIRHTRLLEASDDADAILQAESLQCKDELEVWDRTRLVGRVEGRSAAATSWDHLRSPVPMSRPGEMGHAGSP